MQTPVHDASATHTATPFSQAKHLRAEAQPGLLSPPHEPGAGAGAGSLFIPQGRQGRSRREGSPSGGTESQANTFKFLYIVLPGTTRRP